MKLGFEHNLGICCICTYYRFENDTAFIDLGFSRLKLGFQKDLELFAFVLIGLKTILLSSIWGSSGLELGFQKDLRLFEFVFLAQFC